MSKKLYIILFLMIITLSACANISSASSENGESLSENESSISIDTDSESESTRVAQPPPEEAQTSRASELDTVPRTFYRYSVEDVTWDDDASKFPSEWLEAAKKVVDAEDENYDGQFTRGWQYDIDGDGRMTGILLFRVLEANSNLWGNSFFIYISADGNAQILTMGEDAQWDDRRKMNIELLKYQGFTHVFVRSGANNATSGSFGAIYREKNGVLERLFSDFWFLFKDSGVFFETQGPQGQGPTHYFWDELKGRYSAVGGTEISFDEFLGVFAVDKIIWDGLYDIDIEQLEESPPSEYKAEMFEAIEVYGNRYYQLLYRDFRPIFFTVWEKTVDEKWRYVSVATGPMRQYDEGIIVHQIDMFEAEQNAIF